MSVLDSLNEVLEPPSEIVLGECDACHKLRNVVQLPEVMLCGDCLVDLANEVVFANPP